jgi:hypothetical protein
MKLREALILQSPSLALQRAAADEIARQDVLIEELLDALHGVMYWNNGKPEWEDALSIMKRAILRTA